MSNAHKFIFTDIAVVTTNEVDFFSDTGKIIGILPKPTADLQSLEFNPVHQVLFLSDDTNSNYSIFTLSLQGNQDLTPFIRSKYNIILCHMTFIYQLQEMYLSFGSLHWWANKSFLNSVPHMHCLSLSCSYPPITLLYSHTLQHPHIAYSHTYIM